MSRGKYKIYLLEFIYEMLPMFKKYRIKRKLTQEQLADLTNLDTRTIQRVENNERIPSIETFAKLVKALDIEDEDVIKYISTFTKFM